MIVNGLRLSESAMNTLADHVSSASCSVASADRRSSRQWVLERDGVVYELARWDDENLEWIVDETTLSLISKSGT